MSDERQPWTEDDLTSEEDAERATHSAERARELRKQAERLRESSHCRHCGQPVWNTLEPGSPRRAA